MAQSVPVPPGVPTVRFQEARRVQLPDGPMPLIHPDDPARAKLQERYLAHTRQFNLGLEQDLKDHTELWQQVCDGVCIIVPEASKMKFHKGTGSYVAYLRWYTVELIAPASPGMLQP